MQTGLIHHRAVHFHWITSRLTGRCLKSSPLLQPKRRPNHKHRRPAIVLAADASKSTDKSSGVFQVFSDPVCDRKLFALAIGQMLCSIATLIHDTYLPVYMQDVLKLSNTKIGAVQGIAQFLAQLAKGVSGVVGDILGSQIRVVLFGIFLTLLCKPMFALSGIVAAKYGVTACLYFIVFGKLFDRLSKGVREAPTKAVMNELAKKSGDSPDAAYGMRFSLATAGALLGSGAAAVVFFLTNQNFILTFAAASVPPAIAFFWVLSNFNDELDQKVEKKADVTSADSAKLTLVQKAQAIVKSFQPAYWQALIVILVLYFARFDASFLFLRAKQVSNQGLIMIAGRFGLGDAED